jgi:hypothetical protein
MACRDVDSSNLLFPCAKQINVFVLHGAWWKIGSSKEETVDSLSDTQQRSS